MKKWFEYWGHQPNSRETSTWHSSDFITNSFVLIKLLFNKLILAFSKIRISFLQLPFLCNYSLSFMIIVPELIVWDLFLSLLFTRSFPYKLFSEKHLNPLPERLDPPGPRIMVTACLCHLRDIAQYRTAVPLYIYLVVDIWFSILLKFDYLPSNFFHLRITYVLEVGSTSTNE